MSLTSTSNATETKSIFFIVSSLVFLVLLVLYFIGAGHSILSYVYGKNGHWFDAIPHIHRNRHSKDTHLGPITVIRTHIGQKSTDLKSECKIISNFHLLDIRRYSKLAVACYRCRHTHATTITAKCCFKQYTQFMGVLFQYYGVVFYFIITLQQCSNHFV